ncbi:MAG: AIPR family protein [Limisphaerales bacterium]
MNDQILNGYLQDFKEQHGLEKLSESDLFSRFVTFCVISKQAGSPASLEDLDVDGGQDTAIDTIAILINDRVVIDKDDVDYFRESGRLEVEFVFIQSKTSAKFDGGDIGNFLFGVRNFFSDKPTVKANESVTAFREIKDYIYNKNSIHLKRLPVCHLFYASTGKWKDDEYLTGRINPDLGELKKTGLFGDVRFLPLDADRLKSIYRALRHRVEKEVNFEKHTILPKIDKVDEAYLGILPSAEFLKLITDDEGEIQKSLFYDNVRDFQGGNPVNSEIAATLGGATTSDSFVLLNNGITIVAKSIGKVAANFRISDYQIVNGCQTSHVLHAAKDKLGANVFVPVKLIVTNDPEITNQIIKATNRQTEVKLEAFESLTPFHRTLEEFYNSFGSEMSKRLYYERRSKQYENTPIKPTTIISLAAQAKSFLGMFLNEPHSTHRYYGEILENYRDRLFLETHSPFPYYASGLALSRIEGFFRARELPSSMRPFRHHLLLLFRLAIARVEHPPLMPKKADDYAQKICEVLWNEQKALAQFQDCVAQLKTKLESFSGDRRQADRLRIFTLHLLPSQNQRPQGVVTFWHVNHGFGFARATDGQDVYVNWRSIRETVHQYLREGERVEFDIVKTDRGPQARDVRILLKA